MGSLIFHFFHPRAGDLSNNHSLQQECERFLYCYYPSNVERAERGQASTPCSAGTLATILNEARIVDWDSSADWRKRGHSCRGDDGLIDPFFGSAATLTRGQASRLNAERPQICGAKWGTAPPTDRRPGTYQRRTDSKFGVHML